MYGISLEGIHSSIRSCIELFPFPAVKSQLNQESASKSKAHTSIEINISSNTVLNPRALARIQ